MHVCKNLFVFVVLGCSNLALGEVRSATTPRLPVKPKCEFREVNYRRTDIVNGDRVISVIGWDHLVSHQIALAELDAGIAEAMKVPVPANCAGAANALRIGLIATDKLVRSIKEVRTNLAGVHAQNPLQVIVTELSPAELAMDKAIREEVIRPLDQLDQTCMSSLELIAATDEVREILWGPEFAFSRSQPTAVPVVGFEDQILRNEAYDLSVQLQSKALLSDLTLMPDEAKVRFDKILETQENRVQPSNVDLDAAFATLKSPALSNILHQILELHAKLAKLIADRNAVVARKIFDVQGSSAIVIGQQRARDLSEQIHARCMTM